MRFYDTTLVKATRGLPVPITDRYVTEDRVTRMVQRLGEDDTLTVKLSAAPEDVSTVEAKELVAA